MGDRAEGCRAILRDNGRRIAITDGPVTTGRNRSELEWWSVPGGVVLLQVWADGGFDIYGPLEPRSSDIAETEAALQAFIARNSA
jgi:hypothetical protein